MKYIWMTSIACPAWIWRHADQYWSRCQRGNICPPRRVAGPTKAFNYALSPETGTAFLSLAGSSSEYRLGKDDVGAEEVTCVNFDHLLNLAGLETFDFVKMDIEGAEREVLAGMSDAQIARIGALSLEWHHSLDALRDLELRFVGLDFETNIEVVDGGVM
jgi:FkbM family methyltransferase